MIESERSGTTVRDIVVILSHISVVITSAREREILLGKAFPFADLIGFTREQIRGCTDADGVLTAPRERISPLLKYLLKYSHGV